MVFLFIVLNREGNILLTKADKVLPWARSLDTIKKLVWSDVNSEAIHLKKIGIDAFEDEMLDQTLLRNQEIITTIILLDFARMENERKDLFWSDKEISPKLKNLIEGVKQIC